MESSGSPGGENDFIFPTEELESENFSPAAFVAKYRRISSLENLKDNLRQYSEELKQQLFLIINRDYRDFIGIATNLDGVDTRVEVLRRPLVDLRLDLSGLHDWLMSSLHSMETKLNRRLVIKKKREKVECALKCLEKLDVAERIIDGGGSWHANSLTQEGQDGEDQSHRGDNPLKSDSNLQRRDILNSVMKLNKDLSSSSSPSSPISLFGLPNRSIALRKDILEASELERSAHALASAKAYLATLKSDKNEEARERKGSIADGDLKSRSIDMQDSSIASSDGSTSSIHSNIILLEQRGNRLVDHLLAKIQGWLEESTFDGDADTTGIDTDSDSRSRLVKHCLRALLVLGRLDVAETIVANSVLPHARATLTSGRVDGSSGRGSFGGLEEALTALLRKIDSPIITLLCAAENLGCSLVIGGVWTTVTDLVKERFGTIFTIGIASVFADARRAFDVFHKALSTELMGDKYKYAVSRRLEKDPRVVAFMAQWNMSLYMRLRTHEVSSRLDTACWESSQKGFSTDSIDIVYPMEDNISKSITSAQKQSLQRKTQPGLVESSSKASENKEVPAKPLSTLSTSAIADLRNDLKLPTTAGTSASGKSGETVYVCRQALSLVVATEAATCLHDKVHFPSLTSPCLALALRCFSRLEAHIAATLGIATPSFPAGVAKLRDSKDSFGRPLPVSAVNVPGGLQQSGSNTALTPSKDRPPESVSTPARTPGVSVASVASSSGQSDTIPIDDLVLLTADLHSLSRWITDCFGPYAARHIQVSNASSNSENSGSGEVGDALRGILSETSAKVRGTGDIVWSVVTSRLSAECIGQLAVRAVAGRYRMTNRPQPTAPSTYVDSIFSPLKAFLSEYKSSIKHFAPQDMNAPKDTEGEASPASSALPWDVCVVEEVTVAFSLHVASVVETAKQMDSALSRRVRATAGKGTGTSSGDAAMTDSEKINLQLRLDVEAYSRVVDSLQLAAPIPSLARLREVVS